MNNNERVSNHPHHNIRKKFTFYRREPYSVSISLNKKIMIEYTTYNDNSKGDLSLFSIKRKKRFKVTHRDLDNTRISLFYERWFLISLSSLVDDNGSLLLLTLIVLIGGGGRQTRTYIHKDNKREKGQRWTLFEDDDYDNKSIIMSILDKEQEMKEEKKEISRDQTIRFPFLSRK
jgi:hypothetical protein